MADRMPGAVTAERQGQHDKQDRRDDKRDDKQDRRDDKRDDKQDRRDDKRD